MLFFKDKNDLYRLLHNAEESPLVMILQHFLAFAVAIIICMLIEALFFSCRPAEETTNVRTEVQTQRDTTHSVLDTYDRVEVSNSWQYGTWYNFDSLLAHIRIIDFDTLGRPVRYVDADVQHGAAKGGSTAAKVKDSTKVSQTHADTISASATINEHTEQSRVVKQPLPWWERTSFRIASAILSVIIVIIAYLTRHRWQNRILTWLLHRK